MEAKLRSANQPGRRTISVFLLLWLAVAPTKSFARDEWFHNLDLEPALSEASLVLVGRVEDVRETKIALGGKGERSLLQFQFAPVLVLKGVFSRESLSLTSDDLGIWNFTGEAPIRARAVAAAHAGALKPGIRHPAPFSQPRTGFTAAS